MFTIFKIKFSMYYYHLLLPSQRKLFLQDLHYIFGVLEKYLIGNILRKSNGGVRETVVREDQFVTLTSIR